MSEQMDTLNIRLAALEETSEKQLRISNELVSTLNQLYVEQKQIYSAQALALAGVEANRESMAAVREMTKPLLVFIQALLHDESMMKRMEIQASATTKQLKFKEISKITVALLLLVGSLLGAGLAELIGQFATLFGTG